MGGGCQLVHQQDIRFAFQGGIDIELPELLAGVLDFFCGELLKASTQSEGIGSPMCFRNTHNDIHTLTFEFMGRLQHLVGFTHARSGAQKDFEPAGGLTLLGFQERVRVGAIRIALIQSFNSLPSSARLIFRTLTRGWPKIPRVGPSV